MAVQAFDKNFGIDGHSKSLKQFRRAHEDNSGALINLAEGLDTDAPRPAYDPANPDNQWPLMVHHPAKGELTIGTNLKGVSDPKERDRIMRSSNKALDGALASGYRLEPYVKPQTAALSTAEQLHASLKREEDLKGTLAVLFDRQEKLQASIDALPTKPAA